MTSLSAVSSPDVVASGLVKQRISLGGYVTPMETAVDALLADMRDAAAAAASLDEPFAPKAIYVCTTNAVDGVPIAEDARRPFGERQARPILIWRHLTEQTRIDPAKIAVYCQLQFTKDHPAPPGFNLFGGGDRDYDRFIASDYQHIIFNLSLQEGWDDPFCAFAYIDKEMASARQITQVIGRVLRQPNARHYPDPILNTAHFYIRSDERGVFDEILRGVQTQLASEHPSIALTVRPENRRASQFRETPSRTRMVPTTSINSAAAIEPIRRILSKMMDFRDGGANTVGQGSRMQILQEIGAGGNPVYEWVEVEHSNKVTARSIFRRELQRLYAGGLRRAGGPINLVDIELPKFDALVEIGSPADGELSGTGLEDQRRGLLGAVDAHPGAEHPAARAVATRLVRCQSKALAHHTSTLAAARSAVNRKSELNELRAELAELRALVAARRGATEPPRSRPRARR